LRRREFRRRFGRLEPPARAQPPGKGRHRWRPPQGHHPGDLGLVFAARNNHDPRCGPPPRLRYTDNLALHYGCFENRSGEQFVFTFDRGTGTGTVSGGDLVWGESTTFTLGLLGEALRSTRDLAAQVQGDDARSQLPVIDAAPALGRLTGLTGKDEVVWLRACPTACVPSAGSRVDGRQRRAGRPLSSSRGTG
jgi:hypothetical protein